MITTSELVTTGGPSAPAWAFFSAISLALIAVLGQQLKARSDARVAKDQLERVEHETVKASESASKAVANTANVSNGFARRMDTKLDRVIESLQATNNALQKQEEAFRAHLEWHLDKEK